MKPLLAILLAAPLCAQPLPGTAALTFDGDPAVSMIEGMTRHLERLLGAPRQKQPSADRLRHMLGVVEARVPFEDLELIATTRRPALLGRAAGVEIYSVRWPVLAGVSSEGLYLKPPGKPARYVVAVPDAGLLPEHFPEALALAAAGAEVLAPVLIDTGSTFAGNPRLRMTKQTHREWIYRMGFPVGRHVLGYEVQKVLAAVDWFASRRPAAPVAVYGKGEGGWVAQFAALLDGRIAAAEYDDASLQGPQPLYRNVFGLLRDFDDGEVARLLGSRARELPRRPVTLPYIAAIDAQGRMERQVRELVEFTQALVRDSRRQRDQLWNAVQGKTAEEWRLNAEPLAARFRDEVIGRLPGPPPPFNTRTRPSYEGARWTGYEVQFDVREDIFGYGVVLVPKGLREGEKRPLVIAQHGLNGRPQAMFAQTSGRTADVYRNFGETLVNEGWIVYLPQNPYIGDFRHLAKLANPLGLSFYSLITAQYEQMLDWLVTLPFVDTERIGYYGLSYGGKTALRIPPFDARYKVVVCGGDFNEWIGKLTTIEEPFSYMFTEEYEILEWNMGHVASHAELALLMAPRAFMVERGHRDGVGIDEWVAWEFARVRRFYDELGIGEKTAIAYFNGPHRVDGEAALEFLRRFL